MSFNAVMADRRTPWSTEVESTSFATAAEMLEVAGMADLNVTKRPMQTLDHDGQPLTIPGRYANVDAQGRIRGVNLTERYVNIQMEDAFGFGDSIVDSGEAKWERAGSANGILFGVMEMTHLGVNVPGDDGGDLTPYLLVLNSFGGECPYQGIIAFIRPRCINTFEAARGTKTPHRFSIRHTGTLEGKLAMAREALGITFRHVAEVRELTTQLAGMSLAERQVRNIIGQAFADPDKGKWTEAADPSPIAVKVLEHYQATPTIDGIRGTGWGLLNAVTEYMDHVQEYRPRDGGDPTELRASNLLVGKAQERKDRVLAGILRTR